MEEKEEERRERKRREVRDGTFPSFTGNEIDRYRDGRWCEERR